MKKKLCFFVKNPQFFILQARDQKKTYHGLKQEVTSSQKMVYYSQQGFVRPRPLTAPNLAPYRQTDAEMKRKMSEAAHNFLYNKYQKILKNAYNTGKGKEFYLHLSHCIRKPTTCIMQKQRCRPASRLTSLAVTTKLISAFVFATQIIQSLFFLNPKSQASSLLL